MKNSSALVKCRESNYDVLRIICTVAVIVIHVTAEYKYALTDGPDNYASSMLTILLYNTLVRFSVPCFMLLSGAFLLADNRNSDFKYFYGKSFKNVIIQMIIFSLFFTVYSELNAVRGLIVGIGGIHQLAEPLIDLIQGKPWYHMWYLFSLTGIYALIPLIIRLKNTFSEKAFSNGSWIYFIIAVFSGWLGNFKLEWGIAKVACCFGFVLVGYQFRKNAVKNNLQGIALIILGFLSQLVITYVQYQHTAAGIREDAEVLSLVTLFNPVCAFSAVMIFAGFSRLNIKELRLGNLPRLTFYIYIIHPIVLGVLEKIVHKFYGSLPKAEYYIPMAVVLVFAVSYVFAFLYDKIWRAIDKRFSVADKLCGLIRLA